MKGLSRAEARSGAQTLEYIEENLPQETPSAFGLHPNAGIGFRLREAERFAEQLNSLQLRSAGGGGGMSAEERAKAVRCPDSLPGLTRIDSCAH